MAEIDIQEKERKPIWLWFVAIVILILIGLGIYWVSWHNGNTLEEAVPGNDSIGMNGAEMKPDQFCTFAYSGHALPGSGFYFSQEILKTDL